MLKRSGARMDNSLEAS